MNKTNIAYGHKMLFRWSWREIWSGQLWPVMVAFTLIIACVVALSALAIRIEKVMTDQSRTLIAADLVFKSSTPISELLISNAQQLDLTISQQTSFETMAFSDSAMQLISVKAVDGEYPLRGELLLSGKNGIIQTEINEDELWLSDRLFSLLDVKVGDTLAIGDVELTISGRIQSQPELSFNPFRTMPQVFIHRVDLQKTGALQIGGRAQYRIYFNGDNNKLLQLQNNYELQVGESWLGEDNESRMAQLIDKAKQYLSLTIVMVLLMASITLVLTCRHYADSRASSVAMLKSMGASRGWLRKWLLSQISIIFIIAFVLGSIIGVVLEWVLRLPLQDILPDDLPSYGWHPFAFSLLVATFIGLPALGIPLKKLLNTPAIMVLHSQTDSAVNYKSWWLIAVPLLGFIAFYGNTPVVWILCMGLIFLFLILAAFSYGFLRLISRGKWKGAMMLALRRIKRTPKNSIMQLAALSGSLMLIAVIWLVRSDLLDDWQKTLPEDAANVFAMNIAPDQQLDYLEYIDDHKIKRSPAYPIIRGRLTKINGVNANEVAAKNNEDPHVLHREINFTWAFTLPIDNEVVVGAWGKEQGVSVEQSVAEELAIKIGDKLTFSVNSQVFYAQVNSLRRVHWRSMKPNFYFIFTPDVIAQLPATWLLSFRVNDQESQILNKLARKYPTVSLIDFRHVGEKIQSILTQITWSLTVLAGLGVFSGVLLIFTLLRLNLKQRQEEIMLYRTLGASKGRISQTLWSEYGLMAVTAGLVAVIGAEGIIFSLMKWGFSLTVNFHWLMWLFLPLIALFIIYVSLFSVIKQLLKPLQ